MLRPGRLLYIVPLLLNSPIPCISQIVFLISLQFCGYGMQAEIIFIVLPQGISGIVSEASWEDSLAEDFLSSGTISLPCEHLHVTAQNISGRFLI